MMTAFSEFQIYLKGTSGVYFLHIKHKTKKKFMKMLSFYFVI